MQVFISAGEPSGDLHGASLTNSLRRHLPGVRVTGFGGERMAAAGADLHYPLTDLAVMWFGRVVAHLPTFFKIGRKADVYFRSAQRPDAVVLIDYPGFNFALAKRAHRSRVPVFYFVPPQLWGWAGWRVAKMRKWVDTVLTALPFEEDWYRERGVNTKFIGHPYFDELAEQRPDREFVAAQKVGGPLVTLLPGSRNQEVAANLPLMLESAGKIRDTIPDVRFAVASFNDRQAAVARTEVASSGLPVQVHVRRTPELIEAADACIAVSGSVSLELLYRQKPTAIVYKITPTGMALTRMLKTSPYITLVNLLAGKELYPEFLTTGRPADEIAGKVVRWLREPAVRDELVRELGEVRKTIAVPGACERAAAYIADRLTAGRAALRPAA